MSLNEDHIDNLIGKYLAGEATRDESALVERWVQSSRENANYFEQLKTIFTRASGVRDLQTFDTDAAWAKVKTHLSTEGTRTVTMQPPATGLSLLWKVAAGLVLLSLVGIFAYKFQGEKIVPVVYTSKSTALADTLPEGSKVFLNKSTQLTYSYSKKKNEHVIKLKGEAYFDVNHEANKNLVLDIDGVFIRDVGTSFNVKAYPDSNTIEVVVEEGEVKFYTATDSGVYLKQQGKAVYDKTTKKFNLNHPDVNALSYKTRRFNFENSDLKTVVEQLNQVYGTEIVLDARLQRCHLTVAFNNESIDEIIAVISETLGATARKTGSKILIEGNGCDAE